MTLLDSAPLPTRCAEAVCLRCGLRGRMQDSASGFATPGLVWMRCRHARPGIAAPATSSGSRARRDEFGRGDHRAGMRAIRTCGEMLSVDSFRSLPENNSWWAAVENQKFSD